MLNLVLLHVGLLAQMSRRGPGGEEVVAAFMMMMCCFGGFFLILFVPMAIGMWKAFEKAGEPGWAAIVPIYNVMVMAKIGGREPTYGLLCLIPVVGVIFLVFILLDVAKQFDVGGGFVAGLVLLPMVFWPMLGFGDYQYRGGRGGRRRAARSRYDEDDEEDEDDRPRRRRRDEDD